MRSARAWSVAALALVAATVLAVALVVRASERPPQPVAFIIGDSQSWGASTVEPTQTWVSLGVERLGYLPYLQGANGTGFVASRGDLEPFPIAYPGWVKPATPGVIVVEGGGNDTAASRDDIAAAATRLLDSLAADYPFVPIVLTGPIGDGEGARDAVSSTLRRVAAETGVAFVDTSEWWAENDLGSHLVDGRHFDRRGHELAGERFSRALRDAGIAPASG